jgi:hypothetical protein
MTAAITMELLESRELFSATVAMVPPAGDAPGTTDQQNFTAEVEPKEGKDVFTRRKPQVPISVS